MKSIIRDLLEAVIVWLLVLLMTISYLISPLDYIVKDRGACQEISRSSESTSAP